MRPQGQYQDARVPGHRSKLILHLTGGLQQGFQVTQGLRWDYCGAGALAAQDVQLTPLCCHTHDARRDSADWCC